MKSPYATLSVIHESRDVARFSKTRFIAHRFQMLLDTWSIKPLEHHSVDSNSWVGFCTKFDELSDDMTVAVPVCINK